MAPFHRFYKLIPLFLALLWLGGCAGGVGGPWSGAGTAAPHTPSTSAAGGVYGEVGPYAQTSQSPLSPMPPEGGPVKVAILLPLSGTSSAIGQSMLQAAQLAVFDAGYENLELISKDTQGTAQGAATAATAAIAEGAQLILGPLFADEVRAVRGVAQMRGINVLGFSTDWTLAGGNVFLMGFLPFDQVQRIASYAAANSLHRIAIAAPNDQYGTTVSQAFETEARRQGVTISRALSSPESYDAVFIPAGGQGLQEALASVNNPQARKLGTGLWDDPRIAAAPQMQGAVFAAPSPRARESFENRYRSTYGNAPVRIATLAYDAASLAITLAKSGLERTGRPAFDSNSLTSPNGFAGVDGIMRFKRDGMNERGMAVLEIRGGRITEISPAPRSF